MRPSHIASTSPPERDVFPLENVQARARRDALDDQLVADALRELAFLEVYNRGT
jgi:hypothetical protein